MTATFTLGMTYRPRMAGFGWWDQFDPIATHEELAQIADWGCDTLRICLTWAAFQPSVKRIGGRAMRVFEQTLDTAHAAGLRVVPVLFPVAEGGVLMLPDWANGAQLIDELTGTAGRTSTLTMRSPSGPPVLVEGRYRPNQARDLFTYKPILAAQHYLINEIVGYFGSHPAVAAWQSGEGFERAHEPTNFESVRAWYASMADAIREQRPKAQVLGVATLYSMAQRHGPRPDLLATTCDLLGVSADPPEPPAPPRRHTTTAAFSYALAAGLADRPTIVTALGMPTTERRGGQWFEEQYYGRMHQVFYADLEQQATFVDAALQRLYHAGAAGIWLAAYSDHPASHATIPPLDRAPRGRTLGLLDIQGNEKPAAIALRGFADQIRKANRAIATTQRQQIDPERHWHDPQRSIADLWAGFEQE